MFSLVFFSAVSSFSVGSQVSCLTAAASGLAMAFGTLFLHLEPLEIEKMRIL